MGRNNGFKNLGKKIESPDYYSKDVEYDGVAHTWIDVGTQLNKDYKFIVSFENTRNHVGYMTEKIVKPFLAGAIPIYWGDKQVKEIFNEEAFIYVEDENDFPRVFEKIKYLSENEEAYEEMRKKDIITKENFEKFYNYKDRALESINKLRVK